MMNDESRIMNTCLEINNAMTQKIDKRHNIVVRGARAKELLLGLTSRLAMAAACLEEMNKVKAN